MTIRLALRWSESTQRPTGYFDAACSIVRAGVQATSARLSSKRGIVAYSQKDKRSFRRPAVVPRRSEGRPSVRQRALIRCQRLSALGRLETPMAGSSSGRPVTNARQPTAKARYTVDSRLLMRPASQLFANHHVCGPGPVSRQGVWCPWFQQTWSCVKRLPTTTVSRPEKSQRKITVRRAPTGPGRGGSC